MFLAILIAIFAIPIYSWGDAPTVISINFSPTDKEITEDVKKMRETLSGCGFKVEKIDASSNTAIDTQLDAIDAAKRAKNTVVFLDSHGETFDPVTGANAKDNGDFVGHFNWDHWLCEKGDVASKVCETDTVLKTLAARIKTPQVWLDACFSGQCRYCLPSEAGLAMSCTERQESTKVSKAKHEVVKLMCASIDSNKCKEWWAADKNQDGHLTPEELQVYLDGVLGLSRKSNPFKKNMTSEYKKSDLKNISGFKDRCDKLKGKFSSKTPKVFELHCKKVVGDKKPEDAKTTDCSWDVLKYFLEGEDFTSKKKIQEKIKTDIAGPQKIVSNDLKEVLEWPSLCGTRIETLSDGTSFNIRYRDCEVVRLSEKELTYVSCEYTEKTTQDAKAKTPTSKVGKIVEETVVPLPGNFNLYSNVCGVAKLEPVPKLPPTDPKEPH